MTQEKGEKRDFFEYGSGGGPRVPFRSILGVIFEGFWYIFIYNLHVAFSLFSMSYPMESVNILSNYRRIFQSL